MRIQVGDKQYQLKRTSPRIRDWYNQLLVRTLGDYVPINHVLMEEPNILSVAREYELVLRKESQLSSNYRSQIVHTFHNLFKEVTPLKMYVGYKSPDVYDTLVVTDYPQLWGKLYHSEEVDTRNKVNFITWHSGGIIVTPYNTLKEFINGVGGSYFDIPGEIKATKISVLWDPSTQTFTEEGLVLAYKEILVKIIDSIPYGDSEAGCILLIEDYIAAKSVNAEIHLKPNYE